MRKLVIALDGPSAAGKGLIGSMLAKEFDLKYFQSSLVYRGLAYIALRDGTDVNNFQNNTEAVINLAKSVNIFEEIKDQDLNLEQIGNLASKISTIPEVRQILGKYLRQVITENDRVIMEGRDIGTVIAPNADLKIFITATVEVRAQRRFKQLSSEGKCCILSDILTLMKERDERDYNRVNAPLKAAEDALVIDSSDFSPDEIIEKIKNYIVNHYSATDLRDLFNLKI